VIDTRPLSNTEHALIRAAAMQAWDERLRSMLHRAVVNRGIRPAAHDNCGDLAEALAMAGRISERAA
jgi:hypothetical protein